MSWDVNKLVVREYDYIKGSTATKPERKNGVQKTDKKYKKFQRNKKNKNIRLNNKKVNDRKYMFSLSIVIFIFGCITIFGDSKVYTMQKQVSDLNTQIKQTQEENEALKVKLLKFSSLSNIQENAEAKLGMIVTTKENVVKIDFSDDYFKDIKEENDTNQNEAKSLLSKLMSFIK